MLAGAVAVPCSAVAAEPDTDDPQTPNEPSPADAEPLEPREPSLEGLSESMRAWLSGGGEEAGAEEADTAASASETPLGAPRARGMLVEAGVGALGHVGPMQNISPVSPRFEFFGGYELLDWLALGAAGDLVLSSTKYASRPPGSRGYALFSFGLAARISLPLGESWGVSLQPEGGFSSVNGDVLSTYGFLDADRLRLHYGGSLGVQWYQVSPHVALTLSGGARLYQGTFERSAESARPFAWFSSLGLRYAI